MKTIPPYQIQANGLWNVFTGRKKWTITCGACKHTWSEKIVIQENNRAKCPVCFEINEWSSAQWQKVYERQL